MLQNPYFVCPTGLNSLKWDGKWYATDWYDRNFPDLQRPDMFNIFHLQPAHWKQPAVQPASWKKNGSEARVQVKARNQTFEPYDIYWRYNPFTKQFELCYVDEVRQCTVKIMPEGITYQIVKK